MVAKWDAIMSSMDAKLSFEKDKPGKNETLQNTLEEFMEFFAKIKFHSTQREMWGVQKSVLLTTSSIIWLKDKLFEEENGIKVFSPGKVLGNAVENVHTQIREMDSHPTPVKFMRIVKALFMSNLLKRQMQEAHMKMMVLLVILLSSEISKELRKRK